MDLDCQRCGACCCNTRENMDEGFVNYVEVTAQDVLSRRPNRLEKLTVLNGEQERHLRLVGEEQRCIALLGRLGVRVECSVYSLRPAPCRTVQEGSKECLRARAERGLE